MTRSSKGFSAPVSLRVLRLLLLLCGAWLAGAAPAAAAQAPMHFSRLGGDAGLSPGGVMAIIQDRQGFLWLGTEDGLDRYDGYDLRHHVHDRARLGSLPNNWIAGLAEDTAGTLWIGTDGGSVVGLNSATGDFDELPAIDGRQPLEPQEKVRVLRADREGRLWVGTRDAGLVMIDRPHRLLQRFRHSDDEATLSGDSVFAVIEDHAGAIWIGTDGGLDRLDPATGRVERQQSRIDLPVNALLEDRRGDLWVATGAGLLRREGTSGAVTVFRNRPADARSLPGDHVQTLLEDDAQRLWIGTSAGLALYEGHGDNFSTYRHNPSDMATLPDDNVISLYEDRGGLLWVGTKSGGLAKWNSRSWSFGHHAGDESGVGESNVAAFAEDSAGTVWIANLGAGLDAIDRQSGITRHYRHQPADPYSLPDNRVTALLFDRAGALWVGTMTAGLSRFDEHTQRFTPYHQDSSESGTLGVMSLLEDSGGGIWVGTHGGGLSLLNAATGKFNPALLSSDRATALALDRSGRIWVGTDGGGLCLLDPSSARITRFMHDPRNPQSLGANTVYAIRVDPLGQVWVGTRGGGLDEVQGSALEPASIRFKNYSESDGLPNTTIYGIEASAGGRLWLSTNRGLSRFSVDSHEVRNFRSAHGLQGDEFNFGAHYRSHDGELFFGGPHGYNAFFPERLQFDDIPPPVVLTAFLKLNEPAATAVPHERLRSIDLGYRDDIVTFEFAALDFASPEGNRYRYMLEGFDKDWVDAGSKHRVTYTNLAGGRYAFRVRAANSDGTWNKAGLDIPLVVKPPPWASAWAYAAYLAAFALSIFAVWHQQHKKLRREARYAQRLEQDVRDRTAELALRNQQLETVNGQLKEASVTDPLTGLGNRRYLYDAVAALVKTNGEYTDHPPASTPTLALLIVDLDHLKPVNDAYGHEAGDQILIQVAEILRRSCRTSDFIARWGGDEFVIVYRDEDFSAAEALAERIRARIAKQIFRLAEGKAVRTSCSIGFSRYPFVHEAPGMLPWEQCLAVADAALYHAKKQRNGWIGWAGTAAAADMPSIVKLLERDPDALERDGRLDVRRPQFRPNDTVDELHARNKRRSDR